MEVIDNEGRGFILFLEQAGILNPLQRELLIDRVFKMNGNNSSLEKIKLVVLLDLWIQNQLTDLNILEKLFIASNPRYRH
jgi:Smg protein